MANMNSWILLLLLGFAQDTPFSIHEVTATTTSAPPTSTFVGTHSIVTNDIHSSGTTTNTSTTQSPFNETTSKDSSAFKASTGSTLSTSTQTSSITTGSGATTTITGSKEPHTSQETSPTSPSTAAAAQEFKEPSLSQNPGLVAVICIFVSVLLIGAIVILVKICRRREPAFKKLDEVPMGKVAEDSPFARYPPK